jgi:phage terminase large subunit-like protein
MTIRPTWAFDESPIEDPFGFGDRAVNFIEHLRHPLSTEPGGYIRLPYFWRRIIKRIYGPCTEDGRRITKRVTMMAPRGSRKTTVVCAGLGLLHSIGPERVVRGQVVLGSGSKDQSRFGFEEAIGIVQSTPGTEGKVNLRGEYIEHIADESKLKIVSSAGDLTSSGSTPAAVMLDEFQYIRDRQLIKSLKTGLPKRPNSLFIITMNSGSGHVGPAWEEFQYARKVALGEIIAPWYLPILFTPDDPGAHPFDEALWHAVNPGLAEGWPDLQEMRIAAAEAREKPAELLEFMQLNLGFWPDGATTPFVAMSVYDEGALADDVAAVAQNGEPAWLSDMAENAVPCHLAVDLSRSRDLSCIVACWRDGDLYRVWSWFFAPEENLAEREAKTSAPFSEWKDRRFIDTSGRVVSFAAVEQMLDDLVDTFNVQEIAFDRALAEQVMNSAEEKGQPVIDYPQTPKLMMAALAELERAIIDRKFIHAGHPVLRFCFSNAEVENSRLGQPKMLRKSSDWKSIDGAVAAAMAVHRASQPEEVSWFEKHIAYQESKASRAGPLH